MDAKGYSRIPRELCYWITFLAEALPLRSVGTFIELLIGAMLTPAGFVTEAYLVVTMRNHWSSYYKWLQKGRWVLVGAVSTVCPIDIEGREAGSHSPGDR